MIYTQQPALLNTRNNNLMSLDSLKSASTKYTIQIIIQNEAGTQLQSYSLTGYGLEQLGYLIQQKFPITKAYANGTSMSLAQAENLTFGTAGPEIILTTSKTTLPPRYGSVEICVQNQNGMQLLPITNMPDATPSKVLSFIKGANYPITSITYDGATLTKSELSNVSFPVGQDGLLVIVMKTPTPIRVVANLDGSNGYLDLPVYKTDTVSSKGARIEIPAGLLKHFNVTSVDIDDINYKGTLEGNTFVINEPIKYSPIEYFVNVYVAYKR